MHHDYAPGWRRPPEGVCPELQFRKSTAFAPRIGSDKDRPLPSPCPISCRIEYFGPIASNLRIVQSGLETWKAKATRASGEPNEGRQLARIGKPPSLQLPKDTETNRIQRPASQ